MISISHWGMFEDKPEGRTITRDEFASVAQAICRRGAKEQICLFLRDDAESLAKAALATLGITVEGE